MDSTCISTITYKISFCLYDCLDFRNRHGKAHSPLLKLPGEDGATWPFGEASRIEMQEALSQKLMKQAKKDAERAEDPSCEACIQNF